MEVDTSVDEKLLSLLAEVVPGKFKKKQVTAETLLRKDLGLDSLAILSLVFRMEQTFGIDVAKLDFTLNMAALRTVTDAMSMAKELLKQAEATKDA
jgi:acyl carrier protein